MLIDSEKNVEYKMGMDSSQSLVIQISNSTSIEHPILSDS